MIPFPTENKDTAHTLLEAFLTKTDPKSLRAYPPSPPPPAFSLKNHHKEGWRSTQPTN